MSEIKLYPCGTEVRVGSDKNNEGFSGVITSVFLHGKETKVSYEIVWWSGTTRNCQTFNEFEVKADESKKKKIGFIQ